MSVENLDNWQLGPSVELGLVDSAFAQRLSDECSFGDQEADGCAADRILIELLRKLGMGLTADAYENLNIWRA